MKSFRGAVLACLVVGVVSGAPAPAPAATTAAPAPAIASSSGILIDAASGKVLWGKEEKALRAPASLTKVLTALVVLENADLDSNAKVSLEAAAVHGSRIMAQPGWELPVRELLWGLLLDSGNDAAVVLAQKVSPDGTVAGFMKMVNAKAEAIGASDTHFANPHGLDDAAQYSTARDLALITRTAMQNPVFAEMAGTREHSGPWGNGGVRRYINHHKMLFSHPGTVGGKTGFTSGAGHCLITAVRRGNNTLIAVVLGSPAHYAETIALTDWGFANLAALMQQATDVVEAPPRHEKAPEPVAAGTPQLIQLTARGLAFLAGRPNPDGIMLPAAYAVLAIGFTTFLSALSFFIYALMRRRRLIMPHLLNDLAPEQNA